MQKPPDSQKCSNPACAKMTIKYDKDSKEVLCALCSQLAYILSVHYEPSIFMMQTFKCVFKGK